MQLSLADAVAALIAGDVVAMPTETVYGLAADATNEAALKKVYQIKARPADNPLIVHIGTTAQVTDWATDYPDIAKQMANAFWPGPLTIVLPAKPHVSQILTAGQPTVALRVPNHPVALALLQTSGLGLAAPSANKYTQLSPTTAAHVEKGLGESIPVLDGGPCEVGIESTIVRVFQTATKAWDWEVLRAGMVSEAAIAQALKDAPSTQQNSPLSEHSLAAQAAEPVQPIRVPGQHVRHYSPVTPLLVVDSRAAVIEQVAALQAEGGRCAALLLGEGEQPTCDCVQLADQADAYASGLYAALHQLDDLKADTIILQRPPNGTLWQPILDRLNRAMTK